MITYLGLDDFIFKDRFTSLTDLELQNALSLVNAQWTGVYTMWKIVNPPEREAKRKLCISYLVAYTLATLYPNRVRNMGGMGAMPLKSKKAGPVTLSYVDMTRQGGTVLSLLTTNEFGLQALAMIQSAPECYEVFR